VGTGTASNPKTPNESFGPFHGVWTALATPLRADMQIDWESVERLLKMQESAGVAGVVIAGTTGESPTLSVQEKLALVRKARAVLGGRVRVMAGTGDNNTQQSVELSRLAQDAGADSLLVVTPPYNKPSTAGLIGHYRAIAQAVKIPVCLYHVPGRTAHFLAIDALAAVCKEGAVAAVKEASADVAYFSRAVMRTGLPILSGDDPTYLGSLAVGGAGVISVVSNIFPKEMVDLTTAHQRGDRRKALALHEALLPMIDALFCEVNPCPLKAALEIMGLAKNFVRQPLAPVTDASYRKIQDTLALTREALKKVE
jgi:4-hydroxy-tetrahydrodipicolinate synthase